MPECHVICILPVLLFFLNISQLTVATFDLVLSVIGATAFVVSLEWQLSLASRTRDSADRFQICLKLDKNWAHHMNVYVNLC
jgi:hypothetical protein